MEQQLAAEAAHHRALLGGVDPVVAGTGRQSQGLRDEIDVDRAEDGLLRVAAFDVVEKPDRGRPIVRVVHVRYTARHEMNARTVVSVGPACLWAARLNKLAGGVCEVAGRRANRGASSVIRQGV